MDRLIKFRMWKAEDQKMINLHTMLAPGHYRDSGTRTLSDYDFQISEQEILMQYIGKEDKNGTPICEGDIVKYSIKETYCKNPKCDTGHKLGINKFCPACGTKTELDDFITVAQVVYEKAAFAYRNEVDEDHYCSWACYASENFIAWVEVLGNIYQHPELLTSNKLQTT